MHHRSSEHAVDRGVGPDAAEPEFLEQPRRADLAGRDAVARIGPSRSEAGGKDPRRRAAAVPSRSRSTRRSPAPPGGSSADRRRRSATTASFATSAPGRAQRRFRIARSSGGVPPKIVPRHDHAAPAAIPHRQRHRPTSHSMSMNSAPCACASERIRQPLLLRAVEHAAFSERTAGHDRPACARPASAAAASGRVIESRRSSTRSASASAATRAWRIVSASRPITVIQSSVTESRHVKHG